MSIKSLIFEQNNFFDIGSNGSDIKVCFIGAGKMAEIHLASLSQIKDVKLVGITSQSGISGQKLATTFQIKGSYTDYDKMIVECNPDVIFVAVNHNVAFKIYKKVLSYGIPTFLEKPAGYSSSECLTLIDVALKNKTPSFVGVNRRYYSTISQGLFAIRKSSDIKSFHLVINEAIFNYRSRLQYDKELYDNWPIANSIHAIDLLRMICGEVKNITVINKSEYDVPCISALLEFQNGISGTVNSVFNSPGGHQLTLFGSGVCVEYPTLESGRISYFPNRKINITPNKLDVIFKPGIHLQNLNFLTSVLNNFRTFPSSDLIDHLKSIELVEKLYSSKTQN
jgi:predicted dehydrogenase